MLEPERVGGGERQVGDDGDARSHGDGEERAADAGDEERGGRGRRPACGTDTAGGDGPVALGRVAPVGLDVEGVVEQVGARSAASAEADEGGDRLAPARRRSVDDARGHGRGEDQHVLRPLLGPQGADPAAASGGGADGGRRSSQRALTLRHTPRGRWLSTAKSQREARRGPDRPRGPWPGPSRRRRRPSRAWWTNGAGVDARRSSGCGRSRGGPPRPGPRCRPGRRRGPGRRRRGRPWWTP